MTEIVGRARVLGDEVSTDVILPMDALFLPEEQRVQRLLAGQDPGWIAAALPGDIIVAGSGFGIGSSRPAAQVLRAAGVAAVVAVSIGTTFLRGAVNYGLPCFEYASGEGPLDVTEFERVSIDLEELRVGRIGAEEDHRSLAPPPRRLLDMMLNGGTLARLIEEGHVRPL